MDQNFITPVLRVTVVVVIVKEVDGLPFTLTFTIYAVVNIWNRLSCILG